MNKAEIIVRNARLSDAVRIAEIESQCFSQPWSENSVRAFLAFDGNHMICAELENSVVGYIGFTHILDEIEIQNVAVTPAFRNLGAASLMLTALSEYASDNDISLISREVRVSNLPAISLYQKHGFYAAGKRKGFYSNPTEDAVVMLRAYKNL